MHNEVAIVIPSFNKKDYLLKCIDSVLNQTFKNYDLYIVDNGSTDKTSEAVEELYGNRILIIKNEENVGSSGGFFIGISEALKNDYKYIYLLDNDVVLDTHALSELHKCMQEHEEFGVVGSITYQMDFPNIIQEFGSFIDWNTFSIKQQFKGCDGDKTIPEVTISDIVPAGSMLVRVDAIKKVGNIDKNYFVYWEDVDWCHRIKLAGYKVASYSKSMVWHKGGAGIRKDTFSNYYGWRNRIIFFGKYCNDEQLKQFYKRVISELFEVVYFSNYKEQFSIAKSVLIAVQDALDHIAGKAKKDRIYIRETTVNRYEKIFKDKVHVGIIDCNELSVVRSIIDQIEKINDTAKITIVAKNNHVSVIQTYFKKYEVIYFSELNNRKFDITCKTYDRITEFENNLSVPVNVSIDKYNNFVYSAEDRNLINSFESMYQMFKNIYLPIFFSKLTE